ncbi:MAG: hypothetical protein ABFC57_07820 [Veillonellales bacterium]
MKYIVIILLAVSVTLFIVHLLANKVFGFRLRMKPLLWCAGCAIFLSAVLPKLIINFVGFQGAMALLAVAAVAFAYIVAYFDGSTGDGQSTDNNLQSECCVVADTASHFQVMSQPTLSPASFKELIDESSTCAAPTAAAIDSVSNEVTNELLDPEQKNPLPEYEVEDLGGDEPIVPLAAENGELIDESDTMSIMDDIQCQSDSLDDLMDFAFEQKEQHNLRQALKAFQKALKLYHESETAPFLIAEIGGILKEQGLYEDAIQVLSEGRDIAKLRFDTALEEEFVDVVAYLRIVKNVLLEQRLGFIPFSNIPVNVAAQIDSEFSEWRKLK